MPRKLILLGVLYSKLLTWSWICSAPRSWPKLPRASRSGLHSIINILATADIFSLNPTLSISLPPAPSGELFYPFPANIAGKRIIYGMRRHPRIRIHPLFVCLHTREAYFFPVVGRVPQPHYLLFFYERVLSIPKITHLPPSRPWGFRVILTIS